MRIAFITSEYVTENNFDGGLANYIQRISLALIKAGHEPLVIVPSTKEETLRHNGIEVHRVASNTRFWNFLVRIAPIYTLPLIWIWQSWKVNQRLKKIDTAQKIDLAQFANCQAIALFKPKHIPSVMRLSHIEYLWQKAHDLERRKAYRLAECLELYTIRKADKLFCPSYFIAHCVSEIIKKDITVIESPFVLDTRNWDDSTYKKFLNNKLYLLYFGAVGLFKGVKTIADVIHALLKQNSDLYFTFVGRDIGYKDGRMMDYVRRQAGEYSDRVIYLDKLPHGEIYPIIQHALAVVLPSRVDNLPNTCLESMAFGKIVIGTRGASFEQLIKNGESGFLCEIDHPESLLKAINKVLSLNEDEKQRIGMKAKERVDLLNPERAVTELLKFYDETLSLSRI